MGPRIFGQKLDKVKNLYEQSAPPKPRDSASCPFSPLVNEVLLLDIVACFLIYSIFNFQEADSTKKNELDFSHFVEFYYELMHREQDKILSLVWQYSSDRYLPYVAFKTTNSSEGSDHFKVIESKTKMGDFYPRIFCLLFSGEDSGLS